MKPIYFPFTRISERDAVAISRRLGPFTVCCETDRESFHDSHVFHDSNGSNDSGDLSFIERVCPVADGSDRITALAKQYLTWGDLHKNDMAALNRLGQQAFYNNDFISNISTKIKKQVLAPEVDAPVFMARLFLCFARRTDVHEDEILHDIGAADAVGRSLVAELTGTSMENVSGNNFLGNPILPGDPGAMATETRLTAFFRLVCQLTQLPRIYVTTSRAVVKSLADRFSGTTLLSQTGGIEPGAGPEWVKSLTGLAGTCFNTVDLEKTVPDFSEPVSEDGYCMEMYAIDDCSPAHFVRELAGLPRQDGNNPESSGLTLVFLISNALKSVS